MNFSELFKKEENLQLEKKTLVILRWIAILVNYYNILIVYFFFNFELPIFIAHLIIIFGGITNIYLQLWFKKNQLKQLVNIFYSYLIFYN